MKIIIFAIIFFAPARLGLCASPFPEAVQQSQRAAVQAYPELGVKGSPLNELFVWHYLNYLHNEPAYLRNDQWPLQLAKECAKELVRREKERAVIEARTQAFKDFPVPEPATTPFDSDSLKRKEYLASYTAAYRGFLITGLRAIIDADRPDPHIDGLNAGGGAAHRDHPKGIPVPATP